MATSYTQQQIDHLAAQLADLTLLLERAVPGFAEARSALALEREAAARRAEEDDARRRAARRAEEDQAAYDEACRVHAERAERELRRLQRQARA